VEIRASPHLAVAGRGSQIWHVLTQRLKLDPDSDLFIVGARLEARACFRWAFWPGSEPFHDWATGLLSYLEEALDWGYYLSARTDRLVADLDQRLGWVPADTSVFDKLQEIEGRLDRLEVATVLGSEGAEACPERRRREQGSGGAEACPERRRREQGGGGAGEQRGGRFAAEEFPAGPALVV